MDCFKKEAFEEFKSEVKYIGAFVDGPLPTNERILAEELPYKNPEKANHITLFYLGNMENVEEELFDDILNLPDSFAATIAGYGYDGRNQGVSVVSEEFDFANPHQYGNRKAVPHITYSWDGENGASPVGTGKLAFSEIPELTGSRLTFTVKAFLYSNETVSLQYFRDRAEGTIPPMPAEWYLEFAAHDQNTPFHCFDLRNHTIKVVEYVRNNLDRCGITPDRRLPLVLAAQWHDIGKMFTKSVNKDGYNVYIGHPEDSAERFVQSYQGAEKERITFYIAYHDSFMRYKKPDITDELVESMRAKIQAETPFEIAKEDWIALALLMEADESAKAPIVTINGKVVRTMEGDFEKIHFLLTKLVK